MRILLKISWEAFKWNNLFGIEPQASLKLAWEIKKIVDLWVEISVVVWWWNIYRWKDLIKSGLHASDSHNLSMLSTIFNWVILKDKLENLWQKAVVMTSLDIDFIEKFNKEKAINYIRNGTVVIFVWWTGRPYFTTDTTAILMALETKSELVIKATKVDWVYNKDPEKYKESKLIKKISYEDFIKKDLKVMDVTSIVMAKDNKLKIRVINYFKPWILLSVFSWKEEGTIIS